MGLNLKPLEDFPRYCIQDDGSVYLDDYGRLKKRRPSLTPDGQTKITLYRHGVAYTRSLALLVAKAHVYNDWDPEIFNTPIHLNNDLADNRAVNLAWRPRWFALKYQRQYWNEEYRFERIAIRDRKTGERYGSLREVCQKYGLLYVDVLNSCTRNEPCFPVWREFCFDN